MLRVFSSRKKKHSVQTEKAISQCDLSASANQTKNHKRTECRKEKNKTTTTKTTSIRKTKIDKGMNRDEMQ